MPHVHVLIVHVGNEARLMCKPVRNTLYAPFVVFDHELLLFWIRSRGRNAALAAKTERILDGGRVAGGFGGEVGRRRSLTEGFALLALE